MNYVTNLSQNVEFDQLPSQVCIKAQNKHQTKVRLLSVVLRDFCLGEAEKYVSERENNWNDNFAELGEWVVQICVGKIDLH